jgi:hypothetical protein
MPYETRILDLVTPNVQKVLARYRDEHRLTEIAKKMDLAAPRLTEFLTGKRKLSYYYLVMFIRKGVMSMEDIWGDIDATKLPKEQQIVVQRLKMEDAIVEAVVQAQAKGINVAKVLSALSE